MRGGRSALRRIAVSATTGVYAIEDELDNTADEAHERRDVSEEYVPVIPVFAVEMREVPAGQHDDKAGTPERSIHVREKLVNDANPAEWSTTRENTCNNEEGASEETV